MSEQLSALVQIIASNVAILQSNLQANYGGRFPDLNEPCQVSFERSLLQDTAIASASQQIVAAAHQLIASVQAPLDTILDYATGSYSTATLQFVNDNDIADTLADAGSEGLNVVEIGRRIGVDGNHVARCLRYLSTRHIFCEVRPGVFANSRHSSMLVKRKKLEDLRSRPLEKYTNAPIAAFVNLVTDEAFMASQKLTDWLTHPLDFSAPFNLAICDSVDLFQWFHRRENRWRIARFSAVMEAWSDRWPASIFSSAFDWGGLKGGSKVVDVGGNRGSTTMIIARTAPTLRYIVQDLEPVTEVAIKYWEKEWPEAISDGIVSFDVHDIFEPMTLVADVYILRAVIHDWEDSKAQRILENIRHAAKASSKLILFEMVSLPSCHDPSNIEAESSFSGEPTPLLANVRMGAGRHATTIDIQLMLLTIGGEVRTMEKFIKLGRSAGWQLESVKQGPVSAFIYSPIL